MRWFWIDRFTEFVSGSHATAVKCIALCEDHLGDHWPAYPLMPNSLVAEGMAQCGGLLVSETYKFAELVVLAKFSRCEFEGEARPGDVLRYRAEIQQVKEFGASVRVVGHIDDRRYCEADIFFARLSAQAADGSEMRRLFDPADLHKWLRVVGVFDVGVRPDGSRLKPQDYGFDTI